jgi:anti-sigma-K factor RskA
VNHEQLIEAVPLYVAGALDASEKRELEQHLDTGCSLCETHLQEYQEAVSLLPYGLPVSPVPETLKGQVLSQISQESGSTGTSRVRRPAKTGFLQWLFPERGLRPAVAFVLIGALSVVMMYAVTLQSRLSEIENQEAILQVALEKASKDVASLQTQLSQEKTELQGLQAQLSGGVSTQAQLQDQIVRQTTELEKLGSQMTARRQEMDLLRRTVSEKDAMLRFLLSPQVKVVSFKGRKDFPGEAILLYDPQEKRGLLYAFKLRPLPPGKTYQLWAVVDKPISMGVFNLDHGQNGRLLTKNLVAFSQVDHFGVSLEPAGGVQQPTGDVHLVGNP